MVHVGARMAQQPPPLAGLVLCGGHSRRMGVDKALLVLDGERLVDRAAARLGAVAAPVLLACGARALTVAGCSTVADMVAGAGPLGGIAAGLRVSPHRLLAVVAVDMPWLDAALLAGLAAAWRPGDDAVVPLSGRGPEPLHAVYARSALAVLEEALGAGRLRIQDALGGLRVRTVDAAELAGDIATARFALNLNRPADLLSLGELPPAPA